MKNLDHTISKWIYDRAHATPVFLFFSVVGARYAIYVLGFMTVLITPDVFPLCTPISNGQIFGFVQMIGMVWFITFLLQLLVRRKRPFECKLYEARIPLMCKTPSFPSAHTSLSFALVFLAITSLSWWTSSISHISQTTALIGVILFFFYAAWVALSRVAVGVHYFSDVIVGAVLGFFLPWVLIALAYTYGS
jgi:membrane-associated phospholipid phosphatase